jgi:hypothetical protein
VTIGGNNHPSWLLFRDKRNIYCSALMLKWRQKAYGLRLSGFSGLIGFVVAGDAGKVEVELDASALLIISFVQ